MSLCYVVPEIALPKMATTVPKIELSYSGEDRGAGDQEKRGAGGVREAGEEGAGSGIPKVAGSGRKREKLRNITQYFAIEKWKGAGAKKYRAGTGIKGYGKREV